MPLICLIRFLPCCYARRVHDDAALARYTCFRKKSAIDMRATIYAEVHRHARAAKKGAAGNERDVTLRRVLAAAILYITIV